MRNSRKLDQYILLYLFQQPFHGFELYKKIDRMMRGVNIDTAGVYRTLDKLEAEGAVSFTREDGDKGPNKKTYFITPHGKTILDELYLKTKQEALNLSLFIQSYETLRNK